MLASMPPLTNDVPGSAGRSLSTRTIAAYFRRANVLLMGFLAWPLVAPSGKWPDLRLERRAVQDQPEVRVELKVDTQCRKVPGRKNSLPPDVGLEGGTDELPICAHVLLEVVALLVPPVSVSNRPRIR
jgi:hypothetical protein